MAKETSNVILIWAHNRERYDQFLQYGIAGIHYDVKIDLTGKSAEGIEAALKPLPRCSSPVIKKFKRLIHDVPAGSFIVTGVPNTPLRSRKWSIGKVVGGYQYRPEVPDRHSISVKWQDREYASEEITQLLGINLSARRGTVTPLPVVYTPGDDC